MGARIVFSGNAPEDRERSLEEVVKELARSSLHPSDDLRVIAGQGTCALNHGRGSDLDIIITPVGGAGFSAARPSPCRISPKTRVIGASPPRADYAFRVLYDGPLFPSGNPKTIADGLRTCWGRNRFPWSYLVWKHHDLRGVNRFRQRLVWERISRDRAVRRVPWPPFLEETRCQGQARASLLSGGNVDLDALPWTGRQP